MHGIFITALRNNLLQSNHFALPNWAVMNASNRLLYIETLISNEKSVGRTLDNNPVNTLEFVFKTISATGLRRRMITVCRPLWNSEVFRVQILAQINTQQRENQQQVG